MRLDPFHAPACQTFLGNAYYLIGRYVEAIDNLRAAARRLPTFRPTFVWLAATAAQLGNYEEAREAAAVVLRRDPAFTIGKWLSCISSQGRPMPIVLPKDCARHTSRMKTHTRRRRIGGLYRFFGVERPPNIALRSAKGPN